MSFTKTYIGKGKQVENLNIVRVTLNYEDLQKHVYEYEGQKYITFEVAQLREPDNFGKTHTAYVSEKVEDGPVVEEKPAKKSRGKKTA